MQDVCVLSGLVVSPSEGVVPSGGKTTLQVHFNPESVIKFDTRIEVRRRMRRNKSNFVLKKIIKIMIHIMMLVRLVCLLQIALRSMKSVELRVRGSVEPPNIDISVVSVCYT